MEFSGVLIREDFFMQPFVKELMEKKNGSAMVVFYVKLLIEAGKNYGLVQYKGKKPTLAEELSEQFKIDRKAAEDALSALAGQGFISRGSGQDCRVEETEYFTFDCN